MFRIGCHISSSGGYLAMGQRADALGANTFAFFTRNPRGGAAKAIDENDVAAFLSFCTQHDIAGIVAHAPYTLNPCAEKQSVRDLRAPSFAMILHAWSKRPASFIISTRAAMSAKGWRQALKRRAKFSTKRSLTR